ncbi:EAL domain-containing protein [Azospirillum halopraeferens]|uniref:EAL domain-containing protein n=1 Tax=Azospirillum halopraeferens TaxID=34010 RepID=UPI0004081D14|nr:EAL domain-containing protein [Azospirillum halopraeferens]
MKPAIHPPAASASLQRDRFIGFAFAGGHLLIQTDGTGAIAYATGARCGLVAGSVDDLVGRNLLEFAPAEEQAYLRRLLRRLAERGKLDPCCVVLRTAGGETFPAQIGGCRLPLYPDTNFLSVVAGASVLNRLRDGRLPGLNAFVHGIEAKIGACAALDRPQSLSLMLLDGLGDFLITNPGEHKDLVQALEAYLLSISTDGDGAARLDEDRYAVLHDDSLSAGEIRSDIDRLLAERGADCLRDTLMLHQISLRSHAALPTADVARALAYTLQIFARGRGDFTIATIDDGILDLLHTSVERVSAFRRTLETRDFRMVYQPIVTITGRRLHHVEALVRFGHAESPAEFIGFAESVGMIGDLDLLVFQTVLETLAEGAAASVVMPDVAVNISAATLNSPLLMEQLERIVEPFGPPRRKLLVEITETSMVKDFDALNRAIGRMRDMGMRICLDDVGAGTTSFMSLNALKVDFVKLDGPLVQAAIRGGRERAILQSIVEISGHLGVEVIAEQIETEEQAAFVRAQGVRLVQGFLYGRPTPDMPGRTRRTPPANRRRGEAEHWE